MKIAIIGSGVYGKAIAKILLEAKNDVTIWTEVEDLSSVEVPEGIKLTNDYKKALEGANLVYILTGSKFVPDVLANLKPHLDKRSIIILGSKGILEDGSMLTDVTRKVLPEHRLTVISGPTFAKDISALDPVGFTVGGDKESFDVIKSVMTTVYLEYSPNMEATAMAGSLKNAYAIGSGILKGLGFGHSTTCLFVTRALQELGSIYEAYGFDEECTLNLSGVGDLFLTCTSEDSRNFSFGMILSQGDEKKTREYLNSNTVEGYENLKAYVSLFKKKNINTPILSCVNDIVASKSTTEDLVTLLVHDIENK